jgi:diguanylate cyclase
LGAAALTAWGPRPCDRVPVIDTVPSQRSLWLPYVPLLIASTIGPAFALKGPLQVGVPALMALVFIRQSYAAREYRQLLRAAADQASHDPLTGLANRTLFYDRLVRAMAQSRRDDRSVLVVVLDIDDFKMVNDTLGHPVADSVLVGVGKRLAGCVQPSDTVARLGGDEFAVLLEGGVDRQHLVASTIVEAFDEPIVIDGQEILLWPSVGMAIASSAEPDLAPVALVQRADIAMYAAKRSRSSQVQTFSPDMTLIDPDLVVEWAERSARRPTDNGAAQIRLLRELRHAIEHGELDLVYQPEIELSTSRIVRVEALLRWPHPQLGELRPEAFLSLVRQHGLMRPVSDLVLDKALDDAARWAALGAPTPVAVNLFAPLLCETERLVGALAARNLPAEVLTVEITEDAVLADVGRVTAVLRELRELGVRVAIDDFGSGYSALSYLHDLPSDDVKLDRRFIAAVTSDERAAMVVRAVIDLSHELGVTVVAEGIEDAATVAWLRQHGCDIGQGYHLGIPATAADTARLLLEATHTTHTTHSN